jgi:hypothetical protein
MRLDHMLDFLKNMEEALLSYKICMQSSNPNDI